MLRRDDLGTEADRALHYQSLCMHAAILRGSFGAQDVQVAGRRRAPDRQLSSIDGMRSLDDQ